MYRIDIYIYLYVLVARSSLYMERTDRGQKSSHIAFHLCEYSVCNADCVQDFRGSRTLKGGTAVWRWMVGGWEPESGVKHRNTFRHTKATVFSLFALRIFHGSNNC